jgi:nucleoid-associated protein YgaU
MAKETKIGLAVIGVLLSVFGVLLFRHLSITSPATSRTHEHQPVQPLAAPAKDKPNVVTAQNGPTGSGAADSLWGSPGTSSPSAPEVPAASYMPEDTDRPGEPAADRYALEGRDVEPADERAAAPPGAKVFQNRAAGAAPAELPSQQSTGQARRNPLRRLSAEVPLSDSESADEDHGAAAPEVPDQTEPGATADPYAFDEQPAQPSDASDSPPPADPPASSQLDDPFPDAVPDAPGAEAADESGRQPLEPVPASAPAVELPAREAPQPPIQDAWQTDVAGEPSPPREPLPLEDGMYVVQPNDTLWSISEKVYGTGGYFKAIAAHNRSSLPRSDQLSVGMRVAVPPAQELEQKYPSLCPKQRHSALVRPRAGGVAPARHAAGGDVYVVEEGDTLFDIARYELGKATRWAEIYELNRDKLGEDFDYLQPGLELRLPQRQDAETIGRGGDGSSIVR